MSQAEIEAIETKLSAITAELAQRKGELAGLIKDWHSFLELSWVEQQRLRELCPERVAQLERDFFRKLTPGVPG